VKTRHTNTYQSMGVGRKFSRGALGDFFKIFPGGPKVVKFAFSHSKLTKQSFFAKNVKIQRGTGIMITVYQVWIFSSQSEESSQKRCSQCILNVATNVWLPQNCGVIYKTNTVFIRTSPCNFSSNSTNICANSKIPSSHQSEMTLLIQCVLTG